MVDDDVVQCSKIQARLAILMFIVNGPLLIIVNANLMNQVGYTYPAILTSLGTSSTFVLASILRLCSPSARRLTCTECINVVLPIGAMSSVAMVCGNVAYLYLSIAFLQMLKSLTPVFIVFVAAAFKLEQLTRGLMTAVILICAGSGIASAGEVHFSWIGFWLVNVSHIGEALRLVLTESTMKHMKLSPFDSMYYSSGATAGCQFCYILVMERNGLTKDYGLLLHHWPLALSSCVLGVFVNASSVCIIGHMNSLTIKVIAILRGIMLTTLAALFLPGNHVSTIEWMGYCISIVGFTVYQAEMMRRRQGGKPALAATSNMTTPSIGDVGQNLLLEVTPRRAVGSLAGRNV